MWKMDRLAREQAIFAVAKNVRPVLTLKPSVIENRTQTRPQNWVENVEIPNNK